MKLQAPTSKLQTAKIAAESLELGVWNFSGAWCLEFEVFL
jgi:hypothetical protein